MFDHNSHDDAELTALESQLTAVALPPTPEQRGRLLYACGQAAGRAEMKRRLHLATGVATVCLLVSLGMGLTLVTRGGSQAVVVEGALARGPQEHSATAFRTDVPPIDEPTRTDRSPGQLTVTSSVEQLLAFEQKHGVRPQGILAQNVPRQRILRAADIDLSDEL